MRTFEATAPLYHLTCEYKVGINQREKWTTEYIKGNEHDVEMDTVNQTYVHTETARGQGAPPSVPLALPAHA